jgi:hypothetical protein
VGKRTSTSVNAATATPTRDKHRAHIQVVDLPRLRLARIAIGAHHRLLSQALIDLGIDAAEYRVNSVIRALDHVLNDDFRSPETRGGS